jgi:hypothetical membrane protein
VTDARRWRAAGAVVFAVTAVQYLTLEGVAAAAWSSPPYDYVSNYISDLGVPVAQVYDGRVVESPLAWVMNTGFVLDGVLFALAAVLLVSRGAALFTGLPRWLFLAFALLHGAGSVLVGLFDETVPGSLHLAGAFLSIVFGNLAVLTAGLSWRRLGLPRWFAAASIVLPVAGLLSEAVLFTAHDPRFDGLWERGGVYSITVWELLFAAVLLATLPAAARSRPPERSDQASVATSITKR